MFRKLLKYEFKSVGAWFFSLYGLALFISLALGFWIRANVTPEIRSAHSYQTDFNPPFQGTLVAILMVLLISIFIAIFIATLFIIIRRFYNNVFGREGYLTLTLPVSTHKTLMAKLLAACCWTICSGLIFFLSIFFLFLPLLTLRPLSAYATLHLDQLLSALTNPTFLLLLISFLLGAITNVLAIYFAISLGQLFHDYRGLLAFVFYFAINFIRLIASILLEGKGSGTFMLVGTSSGFNDYFQIILSLIIDLAYALLFYFGSYYIIKNRLNIQ